MPCPPPSAFLFSLERQLPDPFPPGGRGRGVGQLARLTSRRCQLGGGGAGGLFTQGCELKVVLNPVTRVVLNPALVTGHPE
jgi:hypothetical protein